MHLQRGQLTRRQEMDSYDSLFKTIEDYKDITIDALTYSKIGKGESERLAERLVYAARIWS